MGMVSCLIFSGRLMQAVAMEVVRTVAVAEFVQ